MPALFTVLTMIMPMEAMVMIALATVMQIWLEGPGSARRPQVGGQGAELAGLRPPAPCQGREGRAHAARRQGGARRRGPTLGGRQGWFRIAGRGFLGGLRGLFEALQKVSQDFGSSKDL